MYVRYTTKYTATISVIKTVDAISLQPKIHVLTREPPILRINDWVCHSGRTSGQAENGGVLNKRGESCGRITGTERGTSVCGCNGWTSTQACEGRSFIVVSGKNGTNLRAYSGDSGGPWYKTTSSGEVIAMGIHSASSKTTIGEIYTTARFSPLYLAYDLGGITIPTTRDYD